MSIGRLIAMLKSPGRWESTLIVFTSDHEEGLGDYGVIEHVDHLYDPVSKVPLIFVLPGRLPAGAVVPGPVRHVDVLPTILDLAGLEIPSAIHGRSLVELALDSSGTEPRPVIAQTLRPEASFDRTALVYQGYKYIVSQPGGEEELYLLSDDPNELRNLDQDEPRILARLRETLWKELEDGTAEKRGR